MAHNNWKQLSTLISLLDDERNSIILHIDANARSFNSSAIQLPKKASIRMIPRSRIRWGSRSQIDCEISLLKEALLTESDYYHLLSGADLPLHSMDYIDLFFSQHSGYEFIHFTECNESITPETRERISFYHPFQSILGKHNYAAEKILTYIQRKCNIDRIGENLPLGKGANWCSITKPFVEYLILQWSSYTNLFNSSSCGDEIFLQTIFINSPFIKNLFHPESDDDYSSIMRLIDWERGTPYTFRNTDYIDLIQSPMLFARKFNEDVDSLIIEQIAEHVRSE